MKFTDYSNASAKSDVQQGSVMMGIGIVLLVVSAAMLRSHISLLKGNIVPLS